ncbi:MAG: hypothetical protein JOZ03_11790 [Gammaproteobacteria bacterium]|nr:hypothetical protein [Gammaproteobacteria bacterium]
MTGAKLARLSGSKHDDGLVVVLKSGRLLLWQKVLLELLAIGCLLGSVAVWKMFQFHDRLNAIEDNSRWEAGISSAASPRPIVLFGDSEIYSWPLARSFGTLPVLNRGLSGDLATRGSNRFAGVILGTRPGTVVILIGTNDLKFSKDPVPSIERMVLRAQGLGWQPVLCSLLPARGVSELQRPGIRATNETLRLFAAEHAIAFVDLFGALADRGGKMPVAYSDDGLHPNDAGYLVMTKALLPYLVTSPALGNQEPDRAPAQ